jgi:hypothetical protein
MVLHFTITAKPSRRESRDEAKTTSSGREPELYKPLSLLPWSKALELISAKTVNLALTFRPCEVYSRLIIPPNRVKTGTCSCLSRCCTYVGKDEKYNGGLVKSYKQNIMEYQSYIPRLKAQELNPSQHQVNPLTLKVRWCSVMKCRYFCRACRSWRTWAAATTL